MFFSDSAKNPLALDNARYLFEYHDDLVRKLQQHILYMSKAELRTARWPPRIGPKAYPTTLQPDCYLYQTHFPFSA